MFLHESRFSYPFTVLILLGAWNPKTENVFLSHLYVLFKLSIIYLVITCSVLLILYLIDSFPDVNKMSWNVCVLTVFVGAVLKNVFMGHNTKVLDSMRVRLYKDEKSRTTEEGDAINARFLKEFKYMSFSLIMLASIFVPIWFTIIYINYLGGSREWPLPAKFFYAVDPDNEFEYMYIFIIHVLVSYLGLTYLVVVELCIFSILIQICREFAKISSEIILLSNAYRESNVHDRFVEVNPTLRKNETKKLIRRLAKRHKELFRYVQDFEKVFNIPMFLQFIGGSFLAVVTGIQCLLSLNNQTALISSNLSYLVAYVSVIILDLFFLSIYATRIKSLCAQIGDEVYFTLWYKMDVDIQKDICLLLRRFQTEPKITAGKILELDLNAFMHAMRNIYSGLALFQQLES